MPRRLDKTLADYLVIAVSPALIMAMVGSLVFFLVEVFYQGQYEGRLTFVLALFVMAAVLIGRISIELGTERATMYAMPLAAVTALAINKFVVAQGGRLGSMGLVLNLALLGLIWWAAHKLVWDCTLIDETQDSSGQGLLQVAGLEGDAASGQPAQAEAPAEDEPPEPEGVTSRDDRPRPWWERLRDAPSKPHAPGVWIVYFSLAALPIFGLGQALVPSGSPDQRRYVFKLLLAYVASGLALLLTTSFLGLRRYLRQRRLQMPIAMAGVWIALGAAMIGAILLFALLVPRPSPEYSWDDLVARFTSPERKASRHAVGGEGTDDRRPDAAKVTQDDPDKPKTGPAQQSKEPGPEKGSGANGGQGKDAQGKDGKSKGGKAESEGKQAETQAKDGGKPSDKRPPGDRAKEGSSKAAQGKEASSGRPPEKREPGQPPNSSDRSDAGEKKSSAASGRSPSDSRAKENARDSQAKTAEQDDAKPKAAEQGSPPPPQSSSSRQSLLAEAWRWIATLLKWVFYGAIALVAVVWLIRHWSQLVEEIRRILDELRRLWQWLFGGKPRPAATIAEEPDVAAAPPAKGLAEYPDPFATGAAARLSPDELVRYSFEALEAWARERGCARAPDQTPHEFAQQVGDRQPALAGDARRLAGLYCRAAYAPGTLPPGDVGPLRQFWRQLAAAA